MHFYSAYGLQIRSDQTLTGLAPADPALPVDVAVRFAGLCQPHELASASPGWFAAPPLNDEADEMDIFTHRDGGYLIRLARESSKALEFSIDAAASRMEVRWSRPMLAEGDPASLFLSTALRYLLLLRGVTCLHAGAVAVNGRAIAIIGNKQAGKSTTLAALAQRRYPVLSDDLLALAECAGEFKTQPGSAQLRLTPQTLQSLGLDWQHLPGVLSTSSKRYLPLAADPAAAWRFQPTPLPLAAIYLLADFEDGLDRPLLTPLTPATALIKLLPHSYSARLPNGKEGRLLLFERLSRLVKRVALREVRRPFGLAKLPLLLDAIVADQQASSEVKR